jgi:hypothetical protein
MSEGKSRALGRKVVLLVPILGALVLGLIALRSGTRTAEGSAPPAPGPSGASTGVLAAPPHAPSAAPSGAPSSPPSRPPAPADETSERTPGTTTLIPGGEAHSSPPETGTASAGSAPSPGETPPARPLGSLPASAVRATVREALPFLRFCFEWQLDAHPELRGQLTMEWRILPDGTVTDANVVEDALHDETVLRCFRGVIGRLEFPAPEGGGDVMVRYPFALAGAPEAERPEGI